MQVRQPTRTDRICIAAQGQGWTPRQMVTLQAEPGGGCNPNGVLLFERGVPGTGSYPPFPDAPFGVIRWAEREDGTISFFWGHYDLTEDQARRIYAEKGAL